MGTPELGLSQNVAGEGGEGVFGLLCLGCYVGLLCLGCDGAVMFGVEKCLTHFKCGDC